MRKEKKQEEVKIAKEKATYIYKINDKVRIIDSNSVGTIDKIEKNKAVVNYGLFTTSVNVNRLEYVSK